MSPSNVEASPSLLRSLPAVTCLVRSSPSLQFRREPAFDNFSDTPPSAEKPEHFQVGSDQELGGSQQSRFSGSSSAQDRRQLPESRASSADSRFWEKSPCAFHPVHSRSRRLAWGQSQQGQLPALQAAAQVEDTNLGTTTCPSEIRRTLFDALDAAAATCQGQAVGLGGPHNADVDRSMPSTSSWMLPSDGRPLSSSLLQEQRTGGAGIVSKGPCVYSISTPSPDKLFQQRTEVSPDKDADDMPNPLLASGEDWELLHRAHTWCSRPSASCSGTVTWTGSPALKKKDSLAQVEKSTPCSAGSVLQASPCLSSDSTGQMEVETSSQTADEKIQSFNSHNNSKTKNGIPPLPIRHNCSESAPLHQQCRQIGIVPNSLGLESSRCDQTSLIGTKSIGSSAYFVSGRWFQQEPPSPTHSDIECALESMSTPPRQQPCREQLTSEYHGTPESCRTSFGRLGAHTVVEQPHQRHAQPATKACTARIAEQSGQTSIINTRSTEGLVEQPSARTKLPVAKCLLSSMGSTAQAAGAFANHPDVSASGTTPSTPVCSRHSRRLHEADMVFESKSLGVCDDSQSAWQRGSTPDAATNPRPRPTSSLLAAARDQFKTSVGALGRSNDFCFERLRKLDAIGTSPRRCDDAAMREQHLQ